MSKTEKAQSQPADGDAIEPVQLIKLALEAGPLLVFFIANTYGNIFQATGAFMVATIIAFTVSRIKFGRIPIMPLVSGFFVIGFGGLTLLLQEELFIKIKPTVVNLLFASILFGGLYFGHSLLRYLFGEIFKLTDQGWKLLTYRWAFFFVFLAVLNEFIWRTFSTEFWAGFKFFGVMPITMIFAMAQIGLLQKHDSSAEAEQNVQAENQSTE